MLIAIKDLIVHPDVFFIYISREKVNLIRPLMIVGIGTVIGLAACIISFTLVNNAINKITIPLVIAWFLLAFIGWGVVSVVLYFFSLLFSGNGSLIVTLQNAGYGMFPLLLTDPVTLVFRSIFFGESPVGYTSFWNTPQFVGVVIFLLFHIWSCYIWIYAIKHAQQISVRKSVAVVFLSVVVFFIAETYGPLLLH